MDIGLMIRKAREEKKLTQRDVSALLGYDSVQFLSIIERGRSPIPPVKLGLLIDYLGLPRAKIISFYVSSFKSELLKELDSGRSQYAEIKKLNKTKTDVK